MPEAIGTTKGTDTMRENLSHLYAVADGQPAVFDEPEARDVVAYIDQLEQAIKDISKLQVYI